MLAVDNVEANTCKKNLEQDFVYLGNLGCRNLEFT